VDTQIAFSMTRSIMAGVKLGDLRCDRRRSEDGGRGGGGLQAGSGGDDEAHEHARRLPRPSASRRALRAGAEGPKWMVRDSPDSIADKFLFQ
jgi:hypothetical protein